MLDVFPLRKLFPYHRRDEAPRLIDWPVDDDCIRIEAPDYVRETIRDTGKSVPGLPGRIVTGHCELTYFSHASPAVAGA